MAQQNISQGRPPIVWSTIDEAFQKINSNFTELYLSIGGTGVDLANIAADLIPDSNELRDLGSPSRKWKDLYLSGSSLYLGSSIITANQDGSVNLPAGSTVGNSLIRDPAISSFGIIGVSGQSNIIADSFADTVSFSGSGINITTNPITSNITFTNSGLISASAGIGISVSGTNPLIITNTGVTSLSGTAGQIAVSASTGSITLTNLGVTQIITDPGSGITLSGTTGVVQITNSAPNIAQDVFKNISVFGQGTLVPTGPNATLNVTSGNGISLSVNTTPGLETLTITNSGVTSISVDNSLSASSSTGALSLSLPDTISRNINGDLTGSVFADGSTMMIDGTEGKIVGPVDTTQLRTSESEIRLGVMYDFAPPLSGPAAFTVAVGAFAGEIRQDNNAIAIGYIAANEDQGDHAIAVGVNSGGQRQASFAAAFGVEAGYRDQGARALALGYQAGAFNQGQESVAIGKGAGHTNQAANSVIINASGVNLNGVESGFYVAPIREEIGPQVLYYDPTGTKEVTWGPVPSGGTGGGGGSGDFDFSVAADDSTLRKINSGESVKFIGTNGITTASDGEGNITISAAGVSGLASRTTPSGSTGNIADAATANVTITGFKGYLLYKIQTSAAAWVRIYTSVAARTADSGRSEGVDPSPGAGVIAEAITTGAEIVLITPGTIGFNDESSPTTNIELAVTNKSGGSADITVTLTVVKVED
jgi:hypothetical protein